MIERAGEIGAGIGQRETVARTAQRARQLEHGHAVHHFGFDRNEMVRVDLVRQLEQHAGLVQRLALRRVRRPGGIARGEIERGVRRRARFRASVRRAHFKRVAALAARFARQRGIVCFGLHPGIDAFGETQFGEFAADQGFELAPQSRSVETRGLIGAVFLGGAPLHEQSLDRVERRQRVMTRPQRLHLMGDAEELGDERVQHRRELDDELRFRLAGCLLRRRARRHQPAVQLRILDLEKIHEAAVQAHQAVAVVKVREPQSEREGDAFCHQSGVLTAWTCGQRYRAARPAIGNLLHDRSP